MNTVTLGKLNINDNSFQALNEEAKENNTSISNYLMNTVMCEIEKISVKRDIKAIENEAKLVNEKKVKLQTLDSLINELDD
jgi:hypothetical protein